MVKKNRRFNQDAYNTYIRTFRILEGQSYANARKMVKARKIDPDVLHLSASPRGQTVMLMHLNNGKVTTMEGMELKPDALQTQRKRMENAIRILERSVRNRQNRRQPADPRRNKHAFGILKGMYVTKVLSYVAREDVWRKLLGVSMRMRFYLTVPRPRVAPVQFSKYYFHTWPEVLSKPETILNCEGRERPPNTIKRTNVLSKHNLRSEVFPPEHMVRDANRKEGYVTNPHTADLSAKPSAKRLNDYQKELTKVARFMRRAEDHPNMERQRRIVMTAPV